jgi:hypothetical protein
VSTLAQFAGVNLWQYTNQQGASIRTAFNWLLPYAMGEKQWSYQQITEYKKNSIYPLLLKAAAIYKNDQYATMAKQIDNEVNDVVSDLLYASE